MTDPDLTDYIDFLSDPASFPEPTDGVQVVQTHISVVAITDRYVYKLKKPVQFDFLDFSTLEKRRYYCEEEIRLNRRLSPSIYVGLIPLYVKNGQIQFEDSGSIVEYIVKMHRLSEEGMLINRIKEPDFQPEVLDRVAQKLLRFYNELLANAGKNPYGNSENIRHTLEEITHGFELMPTYGLPEWSEKILKEYLFGFLDDNAELLERRVQQGRIVEGHGDLRSEHIHITGQEVNMYDCLEFDEKLRTLDWLNDIAFLLMDLDYRHRYDLALHLEKTWLSALETEDVSTLLTFYKTYRACVRGKVNGLKSAENEVPPSIREESRQKALSYYQLALRYAQLGSKPTILLCMGGVASGKSTLAKELAACFNLTHLNSDLVRKQQARLDPYTRLHDSERTKLYSQERTERVYESMLTHARQEIQKKGAVVLDATYRHEAQFARLADYCTSNEYRLLTIHTTAPADVVIQRLKNRDTEPSVSDMRLSDYHTGAFEPDFDPAGIAPVVLTVVTDTPVEVLVRDQVLPWIRNQARSITN